MLSNSRHGLQLFAIWSSNFLDVKTILRPSASRYTDDSSSCSGTKPMLQGMNEDDLDLRVNLTYPKPQGHRLRAKLNSCTPQQVWENSTLLNQPRSTAKSSLPVPLERGACGDSFTHLGRCPHNVRPQGRFNTLPCILISLIHSSEGQICCLRNLILLPTFRQVRDVAHGLVERVARASD